MLLHCAAIKPKFLNVQYLSFSNPVACLDEIPPQKATMVQLTLILHPFSKGFTFSGLRSSSIFHFFDVTVLSSVIVPFEYFNLNLKLR